LRIGAPVTGDRGDRAAHAAIGGGGDEESAIGQKRCRKAGSSTLRWAAVEAAHHAWRPTNPWHQLYSDIAARSGKNPAKSAVARKVLIAARHVLSRQQPFTPAAPRRAHPASASSRCFLAA
jgi:transposase